MNVKRFAVCAALAAFCFSCARAQNAAGPAVLQIELYDGTRLGGQTRDLACSKRLIQYSNMNCSFGRTDLFTVRRFASCRR